MCRSRSLPTGRLRASKRAGVTPLQGIAQTPARRASALDPESGERHTVKRYESAKAQAGDSWRHERITLKPVNSDFKPIVLTGADEGQLQVIAELVEVLGSETSDAEV